MYLKVLVDRIEELGLPIGAILRSPTVLSGLVLLYLPIFESSKLIGLFNLLTETHLRHLVHCIGALLLCFAFVVKERGHIVDGALATVYMVPMFVLILRKLANLFFLLAHELN